MKLNYYTFSLLLSLLLSLPLAAQQYDLLIINGHLIDIKNNLNQKMDVAIKDGKIAAVQKSISPQQSKKVVDAEGASSDSWTYRYAQSQFSWDPSQALSRK